jgi:hypothetical protein
MTTRRRGHRGGLSYKVSGSRGGLARRKNQTPEQLSAIGKKGSDARWKGHTAKRKRRKRLVKMSERRRTFIDSIGFNTTISSWIDMTLRQPGRYDDGSAVEHFLDLKAERDAKRVRAGVARR